MTYNEAIDTTVFRLEAQEEIYRHHASWDEFVKDCGNHYEYAGADVLAFLGY